MLSYNTTRLCPIIEEFCPRYKLNRKNYADLYCSWYLKSFWSRFSCASTIYYSKPVTKRRYHVKDCRHIDGHEKRPVRTTHSLADLLFRSHGNLSGQLLRCDHVWTKNTQNREWRDFHIKHSSNLANKSDSKSAAAIGEYDLFGKESKLSLFGKFKMMYKKYWYVLIPVHVITSLGWLGIFYYLSKSGVNIGELLSYLHISETVINKMEKSNLGHWAVAYLCYKIATPVRYAVTLGGTTASIRYLIQNGYLKPLSSKQEFYSSTSEQKIHEQDSTCTTSALRDTNRSKVNDNCGKGK